MDTTPAIPRLVVLVGELNPYGTKARYALYDEPVNSAGGRLRRRVLGVHRRTYFGDGVRRVNLCEKAWSDPRGREAAAVLLREHPDAILVLLGRKVAKSFGLDDVPAFGSKRLIGGPACVALPHPSGRNTVWNEPDAVKRARTAILASAPWLPLGEADAVATQADPT